MAMDWSGRLRFSFCCLAVSEPFVAYVRSWHFNIDYSKKN